MAFILYSCIENEKGFNLKKVEANLFRRLLYNDLHKKFKYETNKRKMEEILNINIDTDNEKIEFIAMPELTIRQLELYLSTFENEVDNIEQYAEYLSIIRYNLVNTKIYKLTHKLNELLENQNIYWEDIYNCKVNLTTKFLERKFNFNLIQRKIDLVDTESGGSEIVEKLKNVRNEDLDYIREIYGSKNEYVDLSKAVSNNYYFGNISKHTNEEIVELYKKIPTEYLKYSFLCNMICSRMHCHLILNNRELLILSKNIFDEYSGIFKYIIGYAWITFRIEEGLKKVNIKENDSIVYDIDTACHLPVFPFSHDDINQNPYACILINEKCLNMTNNCLSLPMILDKEKGINEYKKYYGVCNSETFRRRLNIFVNGVNKNGILDKIDWNHYVISGSAMTACGMKYNPLMDLFKQKDTEQTDMDIANYFYHYYNNSDIDLISNEKSIYKFFDSVNKLIIDLNDNPLEVKDNTNLGVKDYEHKIKVICDNVHTASIIMSDDFLSYEYENIKEFLNKKKDKLIPIETIEDIKKLFNENKLKEYFYTKYYIPWKQQQNIDNQDKKGNIVYDSYLANIPVEEFRLYTLDYETESDNFEKQDYEKYFYGKDIDLETNTLVCKLAESIRFKIYSPKINRQFEVFKIKNDNFFSVVSKFHMGFVRAYWNGSTVKCLPSYVSSMMLQLSTDYNYFASIRDPIEIINKYRSRGFGIILNDNEKIHMIYYNSLKTEKEKNIWNKMYNINIKNKQSITNVFGYKLINNDIFRPSKFFNGADDDCFINVSHTYAFTFDDAFKTIYPNFSSRSFDFLSKLKSINHKGYINPLQKEYIKIFWKKKQELFHLNEIIEAEKNTNIINPNIINPNIQAVNIIEVD